MGYKLHFDEKKYSFSVEDQNKQNSVDNKLDYFKKSFHKLPEKAQDIFIDAFFNLVCKDSNIYDDIFLFREVYSLPSVEQINKCQSPIEIILLCALEFYELFFEANCIYDFKPQYEININGNKRIMDIAVLVYDSDEILFFIECDGFEYHAKTKEQFEYTNKKDREVRLSGYDIIHFTGTEIFNNPLKCACEVFDYGNKKTE